MPGDPFICISIGVVVVSSTVFASAPVKVAETLTVGGVMSGYCAIGNVDIAITPTNTITMEITIAIIIVIIITVTVLTTVLILIIIIVSMIMIMKMIIMIIMTNVIKLQNQPYNHPIILVSTYVSLTVYTKAKLRE